MSFAASSKSTVAMVKSPLQRINRFIQTRRGVGSIPRRAAQQSVRTSTNPARSVGSLRGGGRVK